MRSSTNDAVNYFVSAIARNRLVEAIVWLLYPLNWFGIDRKLIALRIALVLELIPRVQNIVLDIKQQYVEEKGQRREVEEGRPGNILMNRLTSASQLVEQLFERVVVQATRMPSEQISISVASSPPVLQWCLPAGIAALFWGSHYYLTLN